MFKCTFTLLCNRCHHPSLELFSFCKTKTLLPLKNNSPFPPPPASDNHNSTLRLYEFDDSRYLMSVESYGICLFVSSLFHLFYKPPSSTQDSSFSTSSPTLVVFWYFDSNHPNGYDVLSHWGSDLYFTNDQWCWVSFYVLTGHSYIIFGEISIPVLCLCF